MCFCSPYFRANYRLESRMRENRTSGSEEGEAEAFPILPAV